MMKWKFGILRRAMRTKIRKCLLIINACCHLHNWLRHWSMEDNDRRDQFDAEDQQDGDDADILLRNEFRADADAAHDVVVDRDPVDLSLVLPETILRERNADQKRAKLARHLIENNMIRGLV